MAKSKENLFGLLQPPDRIPQKDFGPAMDLEQIHSKFFSIVQDFQREVVPHIQANIANQGYIYSGKLYNSVRVNLKQHSDYDWEIWMDPPTDYALTLEAYTKRFAFRAKEEELVKWIKFIGLHKFTYIPGYKNSEIVPANAALRIARGIKATSDRKKNKPRSLRDPIHYSIIYRPFYGLWRDKREIMLNMYFEEIPERVKNEVIRSYQQAISAIGKPTSR